MFRFFKKRPDPSQMFADGQWRVSEGEYDGDPIIVRFNAILKPFAGKTDHNLKIGFAIPLNNPNPGGMPNPEENDQIAAIEDRINVALQEKGSVVPALVITMGTFKEFVFYAKPDLDVKSAHEQLMTEITSHEIQCIARIEENWETYKEWANG
jgi:hypothetical protein